jgi:single-strand selective monofunctional uracil DNA glycosylase
MKTRPRTATADPLVRAARELSNAVGGLDFRPPVTRVYNPLAYAWAVHRAYLLKFGRGRKRVVFVGMNPGPFGMVQTGVPFGELEAVRDWLGLDGKVARPPREHPKRPVTGFACPRSEVSGRRLWGLFADRFGPAGAFFAEHFVANYCPLAFFDAAGRNVTPDKLRGPAWTPLFRACDAHLRRVVEILRPEWLIGVGAFAESRAREVCGDAPVRLGRILHPSPASPTANRDWAGTAAAQLRTLGVWR